MFQMSYGNGALFCFTRVCLVVQGVRCQQSSARTYDMGQNNTSLRGCLFVRKWTASSRSARYSSVEVRGSLGWTVSIDNMHNLSGSFLCGKVCLWSHGGCGFLKWACFPQFLYFTYGFSCGTAPSFDKGERVGGAEVPASVYPSLLPSLILIPDRPQHPLCTHHLSSPGGEWAECTRHQAGYQSYLCSCRCTRQQGQVVQADCYTLEQSYIFGILNTLKVYKPTCRWSARCQLLTHMASTVFLAPG